jgi:type I restriction enzyme S subunit
MSDRKLSSLRGRIHVKHGFPFKGEHFKSTGPYVVLTPGNFHEEGGFKRNAEKDKCYAEPFPEDYLLKQGDVIVAMTEQTDGLLGSMALIPENGRFLHNQRLGLVTSLTSDVDVRFLYHLFKTKSVREQIRRSASGSKVKHTSPERIYDVQVQLPTPQEQTAIANLLTALDAKIELNNRINAELEEMAKLLYDYWFVQFDFPMTAAQAAALGKPHLTGHPYRASGGKMIYNETLKRDIPEGWEVRKLNEVGTFKNGINYSPQDLGDTMAHIINVRNMSSSSFFLETSSLDEILLIGKSVKNYLVSEKSVLIARSGIPGATRLIQNHKDNTIYCGFIICFEPYRLKDRNLVFFNMKMIESAMTSNAAGTVLKNVSQDTLKALCIPFPGNNVGDDTLEKFNAIIGPIFNELGILNQQNQELTQLRDWLLPMLMNGQVTVG